MKTEYWIFIGGVLWAVPIGLTYGYLSSWEAVGTTGIMLVAGLGLLVGSYLYVTSRRIDDRPEDDPLGEIEDGAGEQGVFAPHSWWPLLVGGATALAFLGMAVEVWVIGLGALLAMLALVGWVFEYYRGAHAH